MGQPDGGLGPVDMLTACAARAHHIRLHVPGVDVVIALGIVEALFALEVHPACAAFRGDGREHEDARGGGVCAAFGLRGGHALDAMDACFAAEDAVGAGGVDFEDGFLHVGAADADARGHAVRGLVFEEAGSEPVAGAVGFVHADQITGEKGGFVAAGTGADLDKAGEVGEWVDRDEAVFEGLGGLRDLLFGWGDVLFG